MVRFRNLAAVDFTAHGTQVDEFLVTEIDGVKWTCIRPKRQLTRLEFDVKVEGFCQTPVVLLGAIPAVCRLDDEKRVWYSRFPEPHEIAISFSLADEWLSAHLVQRRIAFEAVKSQVDEIHAALDEEQLESETVVVHLRSWKELCRKVFPYMFLVLTTDDLALQIAQIWLDRHCSLEERTTILAQTCRSVYVQNAIKNGAVPKLSKSIQFPPSPRFRADGHIDRSIFLRSEALADLVARCEPWHELQTILHFTERASLAFQLSEENFYVMGSLTAAIENLLYRFATSVATENPTSLAESYTRLTLEECLVNIESTASRRHR